MNALVVPMLGLGGLRIVDRAVRLKLADDKIANWGRSTWEVPFILGPHVSGTVDERGSYFSDWHIGIAVYYQRDLTRPRWVCRIHDSPSHVATTRLMNSNDVVSPVLSKKRGNICRQVQSKPLFPKEPHVVLSPVLWTRSQGELSVHDYVLAQLERNHA